MPTDHSEFVLRHHAPKNGSPSAAGQSQSRSIVHFGLTIAGFVLYLAGCLVLALILNADKALIVVFGTVFFAATVFAFVAQKTLHKIRIERRELDLFRHILTDSGGGRLITNPADETVLANERFAQICGTSGTPSFDSLIRAFEKEGDLSTPFHALAAQARRGIPGTADLRHTGADGREKWYDLTARPIAGWPDYVHWQLDDVTARQSAERTIREDREKLIDFSDNAPVGFFSVNEEGRFVFVNATFARWLGEDIQTLLERGALHTCLVSPPAHAAPYDIVTGGGARQIAELPMKGPAGRSFLASVNQAVVHDPEGRVRTRAVVHDLTGERAMRQALEASEDRFQKFFEEAPLGIALMDSRGIFKDCNHTLAQMLSSSVAALEGRRFDSFLESHDRDFILAAIGRIEKGAQIAPLEVTLKTDTQKIIAQMHARKFKGSDNIVLHFIDLTHQKSLEQQFVQSQKMQAIGQLAGGIAHDFNNLLTAMIGFCDLLLLRHKPGDPSFADIMQIKQNANRAANLVRQLLAFSRQQTLRPRVQDVTDILTELSYLLRRLIGANIELSVSHGQDLGLIKVDEGQMEQVLINLAVNARDAMPDGGKLTISTHACVHDRPVPAVGDDIPAGQWVVIEVSDTGCGIPPENLARVFEPFFTTKEVGQGTGLGLATVYGIIRQTGGYLWVESQTGTGTTFRIYLPRLLDSEAEQSEKFPSAEETHPSDLTGTARILLVEDEDAVRIFSARALTNKGYQVLCAESGEAALELMNRQEDKTIDLLITDVVMPNMDGPTLAQRMRQESPGLKIIFISGYTEDKLKDHMGKNISFLPKPFTLKQLAGKVKDVLCA